MKTAQQLQDELEQLLDTHGLPVLLEALSEIAYNKALHVQENWQDAGLAKAWKACGTKLALLGDSMERL